MDMQEIGGLIADVQRSLKRSQITVRMDFYRKSPCEYDEVEYLKELHWQICLVVHEDEACAERNDRPKPDAAKILRQIEEICPHAQQRQKRTHQQDLEYWEQLCQEMQKAAKGDDSLPPGPSREEQVLETLLIRDAEEFVLKTEEFMTYAGRINGDKLKAVSDYLETKANGFTPDEYRNYTKNLDKLRREAARVADYVKGGQYPDAKKLAHEVLLTMIRDKGGDFMRYVSDKLSEYWGETSFPLHEGLARCFNAYLADLGIRTHNETKIGGYLTDTDGKLYGQEGISTKDQDLWDRIHSVDRPFYYLDYQRYDGGKGKESWPGEITIYN